MDETFAKNIMSVPACSRHEDFLIECVQDWCKTAGITCKKDGKGNLFLTKGSAEIYPCVTSHLDTVQSDQADYVKERKLLNIIDKNGKWSCENFGIGADDRAGVVICLSILKQVKACKCALFVEEEIGCMGSKAADMSFFDDCGYVIGFDSPTWNRAAKSCSGVMLFDNEFFETHLEKICRDHGVTNFRHEPFTDVKIIRSETQLACMNFSNGGYNPHMKTEYLDYNDMCKGEALGLALIEHLGEKKYVISLEKAEAERKAELEKERKSAPKFDFWDIINKAKKYEPKKYTMADLDQNNVDKHSSEDYCSYEYEFLSVRDAVEFEKRATEDHLAVDLDPDGNETVTIYGQLKDVQDAYVLAYNIESGTTYLDWEDFATDPDNTEEFFRKVEFDEETPEIDSYEYSDYKDWD